MSGPYLYATLEASTAHLPNAERWILDDEAASIAEALGDVQGLIIEPSRYGVRVFSYHDQGEPEEESPAAHAEHAGCPALAELLRRAAALGARWLELDPDACEVPGAPLFEWEAEPAPDPAGADRVHATYRAHGVKACPVCGEVLS